MRALAPRPPGRELDRLRSARILARLALGGLAMAGFAQVAHGLFIHAKARLAQALLERSWAAAVAAGDPAAGRPWPWSDQRPAARLRAPAQGVDLLVLDAADARGLAFGPGLIGDPASLGRGGHVAIAGHRDTHFRFLRELAVGDRLELETADGRQRRYRVSDRAVVDRADTAVLAEPGEVLTLVTCWPFDAIAPGGPERLIVRAVVESKVAPSVEARASSGRSP